MTVLRMCEISQVSRASFYRFAPEADHVDLDLDLRNEIQHIALEFRFYGRPRITAELRRRGWTVNHKRVGRILREAGSPLGAALPASAEICGGNDER